MPASWQRATASATLGPRRIHQRDQAEELEARFRRVAIGLLVGAEGAAGEPHHPQALRRVVLDSREGLPPPGLVERSVRAGDEVRRAAGEELVGRALHVHPARVTVRRVDRGHPLALWIEREHLAAHSRAECAPRIGAESLRGLQERHLRRIARGLLGAGRVEFGLGARRRDERDLLGAGERERGRGILERRRSGGGPERCGAHPVLGDGARLVGADHRRRAERLDGREPLDERPPRGELTHADGQRQRDRRQEPLGHVRDEQADREDHRIADREAGDERADRDEREAHGHGDERDQPCDARDLLLQRACHLTHALRERGHPAELGGHARVEHDGPRLAGGAARAAEDQVGALERWGAPGRPVRRCARRAATHRSTPTHRPAARPARAGHRRRSAAPR